MLQPQTKLSLNPDCPFMTVSYPLFTCTLESSGHNKNETVTTKQAAPREGLLKQPPHGTWPHAQCDPKPAKRRPHTAELRPADVTSGTSDSPTHAQGGDPRGKARALLTAQGSSSGTVDRPPHTGPLRRPRITTWTLQLWSITTTPLRGRGPEKGSRWSSSRRWRVTGE